MEKIIHFIWWQGIPNAPDVLQPIPIKWGKLNLEHRILLWDGPRVTQFIHRHYPWWGQWFERIGEDEAANVAIIKKCDFARLLILHHHGGVYADLDCEPYLPLNSLFGQDLVRHRFTPFQYSRNFSSPTILAEDADPRTVDWSRYDLILSREHLPNESGEFSVANTVMCARKGCPMLRTMAEECVPRSADKVLDFAGPRALSRILRENLDSARGKVFTLPPWYFLWQTHDMGEPWTHAISRHLNRLDWADKTLSKPWEI